LRSNTRPSRTRNVSKDQRVISRKPERPVSCWSKDCQIPGPRYISSHCCLPCSLLELELCTKALKSMRTELEEADLRPLGSRLMPCNCIRCEGGRIESGSTIMEFLQNERVLPHCRAQHQRPSTLRAYCRKESIAPRPHGAADPWHACLV
jgi:hypothetical protein